MAKVSRSRKKVGRRCKLTPDVTAQIVEAIEAGNRQETAARLAGIAETTLYDWMRRGEKGEVPFSQFSQAIKKARAVSETEDIKTIRQAAKRGHWQASAWRLERSLPDAWGVKGPSLKDLQIFMRKVVQILAELVTDKAVLEAFVTRLETEMADGNIPE